jgi:hypothetical protein
VRAQRRDAPVRVEEIVDPKTMREILGHLGKRPYLDARVFRAPVRGVCARNSISKR